MSLRLTQAHLFDLERGVYVRGSVEHADLVTVVASAYASEEPDGAQVLSGIPGHLKQKGEARGCKQSRCLLRGLEWTSPVVKQDNFC